MLGHGLEPDVISYSTPAIRALRWAPNGRRHRLLLQRCWIRDWRLRCYQLQYRHKCMRVGFQMAGGIESSGKDAAWGIGGWDVGSGIGARGYQLQYRHKRMRLGFQLRTPWVFWYICWVRDWNLTLSVTVQKLSWWRWSFFKAFLRGYYPYLRLF